MKKNDTIIRKRRVRKLPVVILLMFLINCRLCVVGAEDRIAGTWRNVETSPPEEDEWNSKEADTTEVSEDDEPTGRETDVATSPPEEDESEQEDTEPAETDTEIEELSEEDQTDEPEAENPRKSMRKAAGPETNRIELKLMLEAPERVRMYDRLPVTVRLTCDGEDYTDRLLGAGQEASIDFTIKTENKEVKINSKALDCETGMACHQYNIPINEDNFNIFLPNQTYTVCATLCMEDAQSDVMYCCNSDTVKVVLMERIARLRLSGYAEESYDYRTCFGADKALRLSVDIQDITDAEISDKAVCSNELSKIDFALDGYDNDVISIEDEKQSPSNNNVAFRIKGVGTTSIIVNAFGSSVYSVASEKIRIVVRNSPLFEEDFVIWYMPKDSRKAVCYSFEQWQSVLEEQENWVSGTVTIALSDVGRKYYNVLAESRQPDNKKDTIVINKGTLQTYCFWAEHTERNASTREVENGTRAFTVGIDMETPEIGAFTVDENYFAPTKTETQQYYAKEFVLSGSFADSGSGVKTIEYTTDYRKAESAVEWVPVEITESAGVVTSFCITLKNGSYRAIAVRACDYAGNVSEPCFVKNEKGAFIQVIVDDTAPVLQVRATAGGMPYTGEGENWTNAGVCYQLSPRSLTDSPAGIYQYKYTYETIGAAVNREMQDENGCVWETLWPEDSGDGILRVGLTERMDRNGYYSFQAISKSGVRSEVLVRERILLQQSLAALKEHMQTQTKDGRKNEWYNKASGVPIINFIYPEYDSGAETEEYAAPITLYYKLVAEEQTGTVLRQEGKATIGVTDGQCYDKTGFIVTRESLEKLRIDFGYDSATGYAQDGIYTLEYWLGDKAGNVSEKKCFTYKIDTHEPTNLTVMVDGETMELSSAEAIVYERFYAKAVTGSASAEYGISGKASVRIVKEEKISDWGGVYEDGDSFAINPCTRCVLHVIAEDGAGNIAEGRTRGIVVDDRRPEGTGPGKLLTQAPQGANENGFYNQDIVIKVSLEDVPDRESCAGLMRVAYTVGADEEAIAQETELFSFIEALPTDAQISAASRFEATQLINAKANEGNQAYISVTAIDRCGNTATSMQTLKIDVTSPEVTITFDNDNAQNGCYYNMPRTAHIHVHELNFDPARVEICAIRDGQDITPSVSQWRSEGSEHYAEILFAEDGDYTLSVKCTDLADNESEETLVPPFTIDRTRPEVSVVLKGDDTHVTNDGYFHTRVMAEITVMEHNFVPEDFVIRTDIPARMSTWRQNGDTHTIALVLEGDGNHTLEAAYTDLAGNPMSPLEPVAFVIDTIAPEIFISGVTDESANAGEVIPVITVRDANTDAEDISIAVETGRGDCIRISRDILRKSEEEYVCTLSEMTDQKDDIYYLTVCATDRAGNKSERRLRFSLNRRGSAYDLSEVLRVMDTYYNTYETLSDIKIIEMNVDEVEEYQFRLSRNGEMLPQVVLSNVEQSGSERIGYTYVYNIAKENFAQEGTYRLGIYSRDRAGNKVNNTLDANGEDIRFVIDNTAPKVIFDGVESGMLYDATEHTVNVMVTDNFALDEAQLILVNDKGETLMCWEYLDLVEQAGDIAVITIPECKQELSLLFRARDAAGNVSVPERGTGETPSDFLVTTNKWVQLTKRPAKTPLGRLLIGIAAATGVIALFSTFVLYYKKHKLG